MDTMLTITGDYALMLAFFMAMLMIVVSRAWQRHEPAGAWGWLIAFASGQALAALEGFLPLLLDGYGPGTGTDLINAISFLCLLEFGRRRLKWSAWMYLPWLCFSLTGLLEGVRGFVVSACFSWIIPGSVLAALSLRAPPGASRWQRHTAQLQAGAFLLMAFSHGVYCSPGPLFPATVVNNAGFEQLTGFNIVSLRAALLAAACAGLCAGYFEERLSRRWLREYFAASRLQLAGLGLLGLVFLAGYLVTGQAGAYAFREITRQLLSRGLAVSASLLPRQLAQVCQEQPTVRRQEFQQLRDQLGRICDSQSEISSLYLIAEREGAWFYLMATVPDRDLSPENPPAVAGDIHDDAPECLLAIQLQGRPMGAGPYRNPSGEWVSVFVPINVAGARMVVLGMDVRADLVRKQVVLYRCVAIGVTGMVGALIGILFFSLAGIRFATQARDTEEQRFRDVSTAIGEILWECDAQGNWTVLTHQAETILGRPVAALLGRPMAEHVIPEDQPAAQRLLDGFARDRRGFRDMELRFQTGAGRVVWLVFSGVPLYGPRRKWLGFRGAGIDSTARRQSELELRQSQQTFQLFVESFPSFVFVKDSQTRALALSRHYERHLQRPIESLIGKTNDEIWPPDVARRMTRDELDILKLKQGEFREILEQNPDASGQLRTYVSYKFPIFRPDAAPLIGGITLDITERQAANAQLQKTLSDLEAFNRLMAGREQRILELKRRVNELRQEAGQPPEYDITA